MSNYPPVKRIPGRAHKYVYQVDVASYGKLDQISLEKFLHEKIEPSIREEVIKDPWFKGGMQPILIIVKCDEKEVRTTPSLSRVHYPNEFPEFPLFHGGGSGIAAYMRKDRSLQQYTLGIDPIDVPKVSFSNPNTNPLLLLL